MRFRTSTDPTCSGERSRLTAGREGAAGRSRRRTRPRPTRREHRGRSAGAAPCGRGASPAARRPPARRRGRPSARGGRRRARSRSRRARSAGKVRTSSVRSASSGETAKRRRSRPAASANEGSGEGSATVAPSSPATRIARRQSSTRSAQSAAETSPPPRSTTRARSGRGASRVTGASSSEPSPARSSRSASRFSGTPGCAQEPHDLVHVVPGGEPLDAPVDEVEDVDRLPRGRDPGLRLALERDLDRDDVAADVDPVRVVVVHGEAREDAGVVRHDLVEPAEAHPADDVDLGVLVPDPPEVVPVLAVHAGEVAADRVRASRRRRSQRLRAWRRISFIALNENPASDGSPNAVMFQRIGCRRPLGVVLGELRRRSRRACRRTRSSRASAGGSPPPAATPPRAATRVGRKSWKPEPVARRAAGRSRASRSPPRAAGCRAAARAGAALTRSTASASGPTIT